MQVLIDTHVLIWWWAGDTRLSDAMRAFIQSDDTVVYVSAVCAIEIAIKVRLGRLPLMNERIHQFNEGVVEDGFHHLNMHYEHARMAGLLAGDHRDPFDRVLAAQSLSEDLPIITSDRQFSGFGCKVLW